MKYKNLATIKVNSDEDVAGLFRYGKPEELVICLFTRLMFMADADAPLEEQCPFLDDDNAFDFSTGEEDFVVSYTVSADDEDSYVSLTQIFK